MPIAADREKIRKVIRIMGHPQIVHCKLSIVNLLPPSPLCAAK